MCPRLTLILSLVHCHKPFSFTVTHNVHEESSSVKKNATQYQNLHHYPHYFNFTCTKQSKNIEKHAFTHKR